MLTRIGSLWEPGDKAKENVKAEGRVDLACSVILSPGDRIKLLSIPEPKKGGPRWSLNVVTIDGSQADKA